MPPTPTLPTKDHIIHTNLPPPPPPPPPPPSASESQRFIPTPFLTKTYQLVNDLSIDNIISWNEDGTSFVIWNPAEFARDVLPKFFKHNNFSSFVRQLNTYGFRKVMPDRWEFSNDCFRRGDKRLLCDIVRRKMTSGASSSIRTASSYGLMEPSTSNSCEEQVFSSNCTLSSAAPSATMFLDQGRCNNISNNNYNSCGLGVGGNGGSRGHLMDENDRLKKENTQLCKELSQMKSMCTNIYSMMSSYNPRSGLVHGLGQGHCPLPMLGSPGCGSSNSSQAESMMNPLIDLISGRSLMEAVVDTQGAQAANEQDISLVTKLFGFQLGSKRARTDNSLGESMEQEDDDLLQLHQPGSSFSR